MLKTNLSDFNFDLPLDLIAQKPLSKRDHSRLLVVNRKNQTLVHDKFTNLYKYLKPSTLLVFNNTQVIPAKIFATLNHNRKVVELILIRPISSATWEVIMKGRMKPGMRLDFQDSSLVGYFVKRNAEYAVIEFSCNQILNTYLNKFGRMPLPPYIKRKQGDSLKILEQDKNRYQTVYASQSGAIAAPTAGLHFTESLLNKLKENFLTAHLTLHVGPGTFKPIRTEDYSKHKMEAEAFKITPKNWNLIWKNKTKGSPILAVGTTTTRVLETQKFNTPIHRTKTGWTNCYIVPGWNFKNTDYLLTNFHLPKSTLFLLVSAFCGKELARKAYKEGIHQKYRFFSYGDAMLLL